MLNLTDDVRIKGLRPLISPAILVEERSPKEGLQRVAQTRRDIESILEGRDDRILAVVGPCSIHDPEAALDYAQQLREMVRIYEDDVLVIMRCYFEKPRTIVGWKGLINDPHLDGSYQINHGLRVARQLLCNIADLDLGIACEFLDPISPQFIADLVSWGAIGARTSESQVHRELASGLSMPVGFKNGTDGNIKIAIDGVRAASHPHHFLSVTKQGLAAIVETKGNAFGHVILRGGQGQTNYHPQDIDAAISQMRAADVPPRLIVDCSHANSGKRHERQAEVAHSVASQLAQGQRAIRGVMIESFLQEGRQDVTPGQPLQYGKSITDACVNLPQAQAMLETLATSVRARRRGTSI